MKKKTEGSEFNSLEEVELIVANILKKIEKDQLLIEKIFEKVENASDKLSEFKKNEKKIYSTLEDMKDNFSDIYHEHKYIKIEESARADAENWRDRLDAGLTSRELYEEEAGLLIDQIEVQLEDLEEELDCA